MSDGPSTSSSQEQPILSSLPFYDNLRIENASSFVREPHNNLDVLVSDDDGGGDRSLAICHLSAFLPFSHGDKVPVLTSFQSTMGIVLAAHHMNVGDGSVVPELEGLNERCKIRFTTEFFDTEYNAGFVLDEVTDQTSRVGLDGQGRPRPCAFLGAYRSAVSMPMSIITGLRGFVQVSAASTSADLDDKDQFPLFARSVPSDHGTAVPIIQYFRDTLNVNYIVVINVNDAYGNAYAEGLRLAAQAHAPGMKIIQLPLDDGKNAMADVVTRVKESEYRYVFALLFTKTAHDDLLEEAYRQGVAGTGVHNWFFADTFSDVGLEGRVVERGSPLHLAYRGTGMIVFSGGIPGIPGYDNLLSKVRQLKNQQDLDYLTTILPKFEGETPFLFDDDFLDPYTDIVLSFQYEAAVLVGLSACEAAGSDLILTGRDHYESLVHTRFAGVLSDVELVANTGSRDPSATFFTVTNFVEQDVAGDRESVKFHGVITDGYRNGEWTQITDYILNDGTTNVPPDLPPVNVDMNYVSSAVRGVALAFCAIAVLLSIGLALWTYAHQKTRVVRASQPFFLYLICVGTSILALSLIPLSMDHGVASIDGCTVTCNALIWLLALGCAIIFSALFTKTYRINKILTSSTRFQRIKVEKRDVVKPMIALLGANLLILALMTGLSPVQFELDIEGVDIYDRTVEMSGRCNLGAQLGYIIALATVNAGALCFTLFQAWQARNLSTEFAESHYIFKALLTVLLLMCVGVPVLIIASDNADAQLFVSSSIVFAFCIAVLLLMFVPKIRYEKAARAKPVRRITVSGLNHASLGSQLSEDDDGETSSNTNLGEKILTTKTAEELSREVASLHKQLDAQQKRVRALRSAQQNTTDNSLANESEPNFGRSSVILAMDSIEPLLEHKPVALNSEGADPPSSSVSSSQSTEMKKVAIQTPLVDDETSSRTTPSTPGLASTAEVESDSIGDLESSTQN